MSEEENIIQPTADNPPSSEENKTVEQPQTENLTQQTENMEVHKHPHHVTHKKKWGEYLLEFFMLFLAVFLGFVAENIREHLVENEKTKQYMHAMVENLKYDTFRCNIILNRNLNFCKGLDSFRTEVNNADHGNINPYNLYYFFLCYGRSFGYAVFNTSAFTQLHSSGNLRLIKNDSLINEIMDYYERKTDAVQKKREDMALRQRDLEEVYKDYFDYQYFSESFNRDTTYAVPLNASNYYKSILNKDSVLTLLNNNQVNFRKLYNNVSAYEGHIRIYDSYLRWTKLSADSLIIRINKIYGLSKE